MCLCNYVYDCMHVQLVYELKALTIVIIVVTKTELSSALEATQSHIIMT